MCSVCPLFKRYTRTVYELETGWKNIWPAEQHIGILPKNKKDSMPIPIMFWFILVMWVTRPKTTL